MRTIAICSGKGGVGKTTLSVNIALILAQIGKKVVLVDADVAMANVGIVLGIERTPISIHNVLAGENSIDDAVYEGPSKLKYVPSGLALDSIKKIDMAKFAPAIAQLEKDMDYVIIDCPPGLEQTNQQVIKSAKELFIVVTPDPPALADGLKIKQFATKHGIKVSGVIVNRARGTPEEVKTSEISTLMGLPVIGLIPDDPDILRSTEKQAPLALGNQGTPAGIALRQLASQISGEKIEMPVTKKPGLVQGFLNALFGRRNQ